MGYILWWVVKNFLKCYFAFLTRKNFYFVFKHSWWIVEDKVVIKIDIGLNFAFWVPNQVNKQLAPFYSNYQALFCYFYVATTTLVLNLKMFLS